MKLTMKERNKIRYDEHHRINNDGIEEKRCSKCGAWKICNKEYFYSQNRHSQDGLKSWCKICDRLRSKLYGRLHREEQTKTFKAWHLQNKKYINDWCVEWRKNNHEHKREYELEYYKNNPEKFKQYTSNHRHHDITKKEWNSCLNIFDHKCAYCGIIEEDHLRLYNQVLHKDHVDDNGANDISNGVPACRSCNSQKWQINFEEWFREQEFFTEEKLDFIIWWVMEGYKNVIEDKPPYKIVKKQNKHNEKFHWELWSMDEQRNMIECLATENKKNEVKLHIEKYFKV